MNTNDYIEEVPKRCPECAAPQSEEQPTPGTHCFSIVFNCGFQVVSCLGSDGCHVEKTCSGYGDTAATVTGDELIDILASEKRGHHHLAIAAIVNWETECVVVHTADGNCTDVPFGVFSPSGTVSPDFRDIAIIDHGNTIRLGEYEAAVDVVLNEMGH